MRARFYCTLFDSNYLYKGLVMLRSLGRHCPGAQIYVLCLDIEAAQVLRALNLPGVQTMDLVEVETEEVLLAKSGRSIAEYCWTLASVLSSHVMDANAAIDLITYLDADLMFFADVEPIFSELADASVLAIEHRYPARLSHLERYGRFNVQWVSFRRDAIGLRCLKSWRAQCLEWCFARLEDGRHGDQKYLDAWPVEYGAAFHSLQHLGAGVAPWNFQNHPLRLQQGRFMVGDVPLIFYHFHQFQILSRGRFSYFSTGYGEDTSSLESLYRFYRREIDVSMRSVDAVNPHFSGGIKSAGVVALRRTASRFLSPGTKSLLKRLGLRTW